MTQPLAPPPPSLDPQLDRWMRLMWAKIQGALSSTWALMDFTGSNLTDIATRNHNDLHNIQGGTGDEYYHLTATEYADLGAFPVHNDLVGLQGGGAPSFQADAFQMDAFQPASLYHLTAAEYTGTGTGVFVRKTGATLETPTVDTITVSDGIVMSKTSGEGIKVDNAVPTFGWRDILGTIETRGLAGGGAAAIPDFVLFRDTIYKYRWGTIAPDNHMHEAFLFYHIPHDYVPGTDLFVHVHWSQNVVDTGGAAGVPGVAKWYFDLSYAKAFGTPGGAADAFNAIITQSVTQQGSTTQYGQMLAEVQFTNAGGDATHIDRARFEPDGILDVRVYRDPTDVADTLDQHTFVDHVDLHYQSTNIGTKQKTGPAFYT